MITNPDIRVTGHTMDLAAQQDDQGLFDWATDMLTNPDGALAAIAVDGATALYNLATLPLPGVEAVSTKDALQMLVEYNGYDDPLKYYNEHPQATQMLGLLAGGWKISTLGGKKLMDLIRKGSISVAADGTKISKLMRLQGEVDLMTKTVHRNSAAWEAANGRLRRATALDTGGELAAQSLVFDLAMSQHGFMEDSTATDYVLFAGLMGVGGYALKSLPMLLRDTRATIGNISVEENKAILDQVGEIPHEFRNTTMEAIMLDARVKTIDSGLKEGTVTVEPTINTIKKSKARLQRRRREVLLNQVDEPVRLDTTLASESQSKIKVGILNTLEHLSVNKPAALAGVSKIKAFDERILPGFHGASKWDDINQVYGKHFTASANDTFREITRAALIGGKSPAEFLAELGVKATKPRLTAVEKSYELHNTVLLDLRSQEILGIESASARVTSADVKGLAYEANLAASKGSPAQVHFNNRRAAELGPRLPSINLSERFAIVGTKTRRALGDMNTEERIQVQEWIADHTNAKGELTRKFLGDIDAITFQGMHLEKTKQEARFLLEQEGMDVFEVSTRTNTNPETVAMLAQKGWDTPIQLRELLQANGKAAWKLESESNLALMKGDISKGITEVEKAVALDNEAVHAANAEHITNLVRETGSELLNAVYDTNSSGLGQMMRESLVQIEAALFNGRRFVSEDMALRHQGPVADAVLRLGSALKQSVRDYLTKATKPMNAQLAAFRNDAVKRVHFGQSANAIRSARPGDGEIITVFKGELGILTRGDDIGTTFRTLEGTDATGKAIPLDFIDNAVLQFWTDYERTHGNEIFKLQNFVRNVQGLPVRASKGIKLPPINMTQKFIAYIPKAGINGETIMLHAPTQEGLDLVMSQAATGKYKGLEIITRGTDAKTFNILEGHAELEAMGLADFAKGKTSTAFDTVSAGPEQLEEFQYGVTEMYRRLANRSARVMNTESVDFLRTMHDINAVEGKTSVWQSIEKTAFGESELHLNTNFSKINDGFTIVLSRALDFLNKATGEFKFRPGQNTVTQVTKAYTELEDKFGKGQLPWANLNEAVAQTEVYKNAPRYAENAIATLNFATATMALRFMELAHPLVTALSVPITTMPEIMLAMKGAGHKNYSVMKIMQEGTHRAFSRAYEKDIKRWDDLGITSLNVSEVNEQIRDLVINPSLIQTLDNQKWFKFLTSASDYSELTARRVAAASGSVAYERIHGKGAFRSAAGEAFIDAFTKRAMGNYNTSQRPLLFQGTFGAAIGLFQTYTWTMGQNLYRFLEAGQPGVVAGLMGAQAGIFGLRALPGYDGLDQYIGAHYGNPDHQNITTTVYEIFNGQHTDVQGKETFKDAEIALYGVPSTLFNTALYTRGVISPRSPLSINTRTGTFEGSVPALAPIITLIKGYNDIVDRVRNGVGFVDATVAAVQLQQLSRPISRAADFIAGKSIERSGNVVDPDAGIAMDLATLARITSARPLKEQLLRDGGYQDSYYNKANSWNRRETIKAVRNMIQQDTFNSENNALAYRRYVGAGGSNNGWRSLVNEAYINAEEGKIRDDSLLNSVMQILP